METRTKKTKNKDRWNYFHHFPICPLLGDNHCLPLLHTDKGFLYLYETNKRINDFSIGYTINTTLHVNKYFKYHVEKCMNNTFGNATQTFIKNVMTKKNTRLLELIMFHEKRHKRPKKSFIVLSCVIYTIIDNFLY